MTQTQNTIVSDRITVLRHPVSALAKTWNADGSVTNYGDAKYFRSREVEVRDLGELSALLGELEAQSTTVVIRGKYVGDQLARERDGADFQPGKVRRALDYFDDQALHAVLFDIDKFEPLAYDPVTHPQAAIDEYLQTMLPDAYCGAGYHWQLSNSHGHPSKMGTLNAHVWMWSREAYTSAQLKAHADEVGLATDVSLFNPVQAHYTAAPVFAEGVDDPVVAVGSVRSGFVPGLLSDELYLEISQTARSAVSGSGGRAERMREQAQGDPIVQALQAQGLVKSSRRDGGLNITCPFQSEHTSESGETATQYFLPNTGGYSVGSFKCLHAHCLGRKRGEFLARLGIDEMAMEHGVVFDDVRGEGDDVAGEGVNSTHTHSEGAGGVGAGGVGGVKGVRAGVIPQAQHLCTDLANANRIAKYFGNSLMAVADAWYTWSGKCWVRDDGDVWRDVALLSKLIKAEEAKWRAKPTTDDAQRAINIGVADALKKWGTASESTARMTSAILLLKKMLTVDASVININEWLLNVNNGTIDLRTGKLLEHNPKDRITRIVNIDYDPTAKAVVWEQVLAKITMEDGLGTGKPLAAFLKRWFGYCATGSVREHKFLVHYGGGSNGKSTLLDTIARAMGDYAGTAAPSLMMASKNDRHPTEIADLFGKRMVTAHETGDGGVLREDFVKQATGGDVLKARRMREDFFEFTPTHKLQLLTNYKPAVKGQDNGIWRRILLVPFQARFGTAEEVNAGRAHYVKDTRIAEHLAAELPGVLAWIVAGSIEWYRDGLQEPDVVRLASTDYQGEQDRLKSFVEECCQVEVGAEAPLTGNFGVYEAYREWCKEGGFNPVSKTRFKGEFTRVMVNVEIVEMPRNRNDRRRREVCRGVKLLDSD